jgi:putative ABC transport system ATP-binding protein
MEQDSSKRGFPVVAEGLTRRYQMGDSEIAALRQVSFRLAEGELAALAGSSGSGKSTLLNILGCLDKPCEGKVFIDGYDTAELDPWYLSRLRAKKIGFIFQCFNLLPCLNALENVEYPLLLLGRQSAERRAAAREALVKVGLEKVMRHRPAQMSGGQQQRVAIARAIVKQPKIILADEPTANLDRKTAESVLELMLKLNAEERMTFLFATHDPYLLRLVRRRFSLCDGTLCA